MFDSLEAARHYQAQYGGRIRILRESEEVKELIEEASELYTSEETDVEHKHYILNITNRIDLQNGQKYINELILQFHNYRM
jgi:hypothetical protein